MIYLESYEEHEPYEDDEHFIIENIDDVVEITKDYLVMKIDTFEEPEIAPCEIEWSTYLKFKCHTSYRLDENCVGFELKREKLTDDDLIELTHYLNDNFSVELIAIELYKGYSNTQHIAICEKSTLEKLESIENVANAIIDGIDIKLEDIKPDGLEVITDSINTITFVRDRYEIETVINDKGDDAQISHILYGLYNDLNNISTHIRITLDIKDVNNIEHNHYLTIPINSTEDEITNYIFEKLSGIKLFTGNDK